MRRTTTKRVRMEPDDSTVCSNGDRWCSVVSRRIKHARPCVIQLHVPSNDCSVAAGMVGRNREPDRCSFPVWIRPAIGPWRDSLLWSDSICRSPTIPPQTNHMRWCAVGRETPHTSIQPRSLAGASTECYNKPTWGAGYAGVRWAQTASTGTVPNAAEPNVFMATAVDLGEDDTPGACDSLHNPGACDSLHNTCDAARAFSHRGTEALTLRRRIQPEVRTCATSKVWVVGSPWPFPIILYQAATILTAQGLLQRLR